MKKKISTELVPNYNHASLAKSNHPRSWTILSNPNEHYFCCMNVYFTCLFFSFKRGQGELTQLGAQVRNCQLLLKKAQKLSFYIHKSKDQRILNINHAQSANVNAMVTRWVSGSHTGTSAYITKTHTLEPKVKIWLLAFRRKSI